MDEATDLQRPLDHSAHLRVASVLEAALTTGGSLRSRVTTAYKDIAQIIYGSGPVARQGGPRTTELLQRLRLSEDDGLVILPQLGANLWAVPTNRLKRWLRDLVELYAWSCFMMGRQSDVMFTYDDERSRRKPRRPLKLADAYKIDADDQT